MSERVARPDGRLAGAGLCAKCRHARRVESDRGSVFLRCDYATVDPMFPKYPRLPVWVCTACEPVPDDDDLKA
jgi:hypothetical protein